MASSIAHCFQVRSAIRGYHVYCNSEGWTPKMGEKISFRREFDNKHDRFAVSAKSSLPGRIAPVTVGHVPREISRYIWYALQKGALISEVIDASPKRSPLLQGGLEVPIQMLVVWKYEKNLEILKNKLEQIDFNYEDESRAILEELNAEIQSSDDEF